MTEAQERVKLYADTIGVDAPANLIAEDGGPSDELLKFCDDYGASLDWVYCGDLRAMILASFEAASQ